MPWDDDDDRITDEMFWVGQYDFLLHRGYRLRPRYSPNWIPSWELDESKTSCFSEDGHAALYSYAILDAVRLSDERKVVLKKVNTRTHELSVLQYLSEPSIQNDPRCHSVPLLDAFPVPGDDDLVFAVIPILMHINHLPFRHVGEVAEALVQLFEGVAFLHEHNIIHGDACFYNFLVDPSKMVSEGWHFGAEFYKEDGDNPIEWVDRWLTRPNKYYLVDYDISHQVRNDEDRWMVGRWGQDTTVPEMVGGNPCDGFKVDVYQMGNLINKLIKEYTGLDVFKPIANKLTISDPNRRPSASSALILLRYLLKTLPESKQAAWIWETGYRKLSWADRFRVKYLGTTSVL